MHPPCPILHVTIQTQELGRVYSDRLVLLKDIFFGVA